MTLQETKVSEQNTLFSGCSLWKDSYDLFHCPAVDYSAGCAILFKKDLKYKMCSILEGADSGRLMVANIILQDQPWRIIVVYAYNNAAQRESLFCQARIHANTRFNVILLGDFNCVINKKDRVPSLTIVDPSAEALKALVQDCDLIDSATDHALCFTHFQGSSHARLDRIYISGSVNTTLSNYNVIPAFFSDHCMVQVRVGIKTPQRNRKQPSWSLWKLNERLLENDDFKKAVESELEILECTKEGWCQKWESFKLEIRKIAIEISSIVAYHEKIRERRLNNDILYLYRLECQEPGKYKDEVKNIKTQIKEHDKIRYEGAGVRTRTLQLIEGEQPTKRFLNVEREYIKKKRVMTLSENGRVLNDEKEIEDAFVSHYENLFAARPHSVPIQIKDFLLLELPKLEPDMTKILNTPIDVAEVELNIKEMKSGKAPGPDGLPASFYKKWSKKLSPILLNVFDESYRHEYLPPSFRKAHTVLIPKSRDLDKSQRVDGYRPISLLNGDYKIFARVLAGRLQSVITFLVGDHQTCSIKGRNIQTNLHIVRSIIEICQRTQESVAILQLDLAKAFDQVQHSFLFDVLAHMQVGENVMRGIKLCYTGISTKLIVNGALTKSIQVQRSVRQGCPMSPLLFDLYLEPLCRYIINDSKVQGFRLHSCEIKLLAYADDLVLVCSNKPSIKNAMLCVSNYCAVSGASVNKDKSCGSWCGEWGSTPSTFEDIQWSTAKPKLLGVPLSAMDNPKPMWDTVTKNVKTAANIWSLRYLSTFGRVAVGNIFLLSKLMYLLQVIHCSRTTVNLLNRILATFIWRSPYEPMRRSNLFRRIHDGGLGLGHIFVRQLIARWNFFSQEQHPFLELCKHFFLAKYMATPGEDSTTTCALITLRGFYKEVADTLDFLRTRFDQAFLASCTKKKLSKHLLVSLFPDPVFRVFPYGPPLNCKPDVLKRVKLMPIPPKCKTFFYRFHSRTTTVKEWLDLRGMETYGSTDCRLCKVTETFTHAFILCVDAVFFWDVFKRTLKKDFEVEETNLRYLHFAEHLDTIQDILVVLGLYSLWKTRKVDNEAGVAKPSWVNFKNIAIQVGQGILARCDENDEWKDVVKNLSRSPDII